ncbi:Gfo/Idh/MocA family protein [Georgenia sp. SYP-B2076]|uniref:Gfo/Idh/MocA family protein n=1 Tax=Georgenia sp. SYP-B2076 TaxID=2495881 RepID=UPI000F8F57B1|nr:Gfo/Idh/MocA family oxidoreductase [Georgenia sp. SYP-B2076]
MRQLSVLVLGVGRWGRQWLEVLAGRDDVTVAGTVSRHQEVPGPRHYTDYRQAIAESDADAVLVTLPVHLHADAIVRSVQAGKHVLCEKPAVRSRQGLAAVLAAAEKRPDLVVMVAQNYRRRPWAIAMRSLLADGSLGAVGHIGLRFSQPELLEGGRTDMQNPLLEDMSIHHLDLLRYLTGSNAAEVYAREYRPLWSRYRGAPCVDAIVTLENGLLVSYTGSWAARGRNTSWDGDYTIECERGVLTMTDGLFSFDPATGGDIPQMPGTGSAAIAPVSDLERVLDVFQNAVVTGGEPDTSIADNSHSMELLFAVQDSVRLRRPVHVGP